MSGKNSDVTTHARPSCSAEYALPSQRSLLGPGPNWSHEPACAEFALPPQHLLLSQELNRNQSCARVTLAAVRAECALPLQRSLLGPEPKIMEPRARMRRVCSAAAAFAAESGSQPEWQQCKVLSDGCSTRVHSAVRAREVQSERHANGTTLALHPSPPLCASSLTVFSWPRGPARVCGHRRHGRRHGNRREFAK